jgi:hypothetical protein
MESSMCIQAVEALSSMWEVAGGEDRQGMARHLFEYLTYDLGKRQIVNFRLKPWADQFLTLRAGLYPDERGKDDGNPVAQRDSTSYDYHWPRSSNGCSSPAA